MIIARYTTVGTPVYESELGPDIGYDNIESGIVILPDDEMLADYFDWETTRDVKVLAEQATLGM